MMFFLYTRSHTVRLLYYMHPLFKMWALTILAPLSLFFLGLLPRSWRSQRGRAKDPRLVWTPKSWSFWSRSLAR